MLKYKMKDEFKALNINITVAKVISNFVKSTFGPKCNDKMLINELGMVTITNDGAIILSELKVEHPTAKIMIQIAKTLKELIGDGTTESIILTSSLLEKAYNLILKGFSISNIIMCLNKIRDKSIEILDYNSIKIEDKIINEILLNVAKTAITGNSQDIYNSHLSKICVDAVNIIKNENNIDIKNNVIQIVDINKNVNDTELVKGLVITATPSNYIGKIIDSIKNPKILLFDGDLQKKTVIESKVIVTTILEKQRCTLEKYEEVLKIAQSIVSLGVNVIFSTKKLSDNIIEYLEKNNVLVFNLIDETMIQKISLATNGKIVRDWNSTSIGDLGSISNLKIRLKNNNSYLVYLENWTNSKIATIIIRGQNLQIANNVINCIDNALGSIKSTLENKKVVIGGGAIETEIMLSLKKYSLTINDQSQEIMTKFADAFGDIPKQLIINSGYDYIDKLNELKQQHVNTKNQYFGFDPYSGKIVDMKVKNILEPYYSKKYIILAALEMAVMILRIDDILKGNNNIYTNKDYNPNNYTRT